MTDIIDILNNKKSDDKHIKFNNKDGQQNIPEKSLGGRIPKEVKYVKERKEVLDKLLKILGISETNKVFYVDDLEKDEIRQKQILDLVDDVKICFTCSGWPYFSKKNIQKQYLSLAKSILKNQNIKFNLRSVKDAKTQRNVRQEFIFEI